MFHPDIRHEVTRKHYAELLEQARLERLAALGEDAPDLAGRFTRVRTALAAVQMRLPERHGRVAHRPGLNPAS